MCGAVVSWGWRKRKLKWRLRGNSSLKKSFKWELRDGCDKFTYKMKDWAWKEEKEKFQYGNEYFGISLNVYSCLVWSWWFYSTKSGTFLYHFRPRPRTPFPIRCQGYSNSLSNEWIWWSEEWIPFHYITYSTFNILFLQSLTIWHFNLNLKYSLNGEWSVQTFQKMKETFSVLFLHSM